MSYRRSLELTRDRSSLMERLRCPVCLQAFDDPKILRCFHFYCSDCLEQLDKDETEGTPSVVCPLCKCSTEIPQIESSPGVDFLTRPIPTSPTLKKTSGDRYCAPCMSENQSRTAVKFCTSCSEYLCSQCDEFHKKFRATKNHAVLLIQDLPEDAEIRAGFSRQTSCDCSQKRGIEFVCKDHSVMCCGTCAMSHHRSCASVVHTSKAAEEIKSRDTVGALIKQLEETRSQLKCIRALTSTNSRHLQDQMSQFTTTLKVLRKDINHLIDCMEDELSVKGALLLKEHTQRNDEQINRCSGFISAVEMSRSLLKNVVEYGSDSSLIETCQKVKEHADVYSKLVDNEFKRRSTYSFKFEVDDRLRAVAQLSSIGTIQINAEDTQSTNEQIKAPITKMTIERERFVRALVKGEGKIPRYSGAAFLYNGFVALVDCSNSRCVLFDSHFNHISDVKFSSIPWKVTTVGADEIAVSLPYECKIQFLCFEDDILKLANCVRTRLPCWGIVAINEHEMAVAWDCKGATPGVGILSMTGEETLFFGKDDIGPEFGPPWQFDFDAGRNCFIVSLPTGSVLYIGIDGTVKYIYRSPKLVNPSGVATDRDGNVYVCGMKSHNIHQLDVTGQPLRIIAMSNLKTPFAIAFTKAWDKFLVSTVDNREELQIFTFK